MLRLRPYQSSDAKNVAGWIQNEKSFYQWSAGRLGTYPMAPEDLNAYYDAMKERELFQAMTAFDETGPAGHLLIRVLDEEKTALRFGFIIVDSTKRGKGYGKEMLRLALRAVSAMRTVRKVTLGVFENNPSAYHCYRTVGFCEADPPKTEWYHLMGEDWKCIDLEYNITNLSDGNFVQNCL